MKYFIASSGYILDGRALTRGDVVDLPEPLSYQASRAVLGGLLRPCPEAPAPVQGLDPRVAGALAERARTERIMALTLPGYEAIARRAINEGMTLEQWSVAQTEGQLARRRDQLAALRADEAALDVPAPGVTSGIEDGEATVAMDIVALHRTLNGQDTR